eukprot:scaffold143606_cov105-Phaeocystis_antarctica.AAC.1
MPTVRGTPWRSQPHAEASTPPARCQHAWHRPLSSVLHVQPPPHRTATRRAAPLLAPTLTKARAAAPPSVPPRWSSSATCVVAAGRTHGAPGM